jgi:hypothetical protein
MFDSKCIEHEDILVHSTQILLHVLSSVLAWRYRLFEKTGCPVGRVQ